MTEAEIGVVRLQAKAYWQEPGARSQEPGERPGTEPASGPPEETRPAHTLILAFWILTRGETQWLWL